jgi:hypothetical protein
MYSITPMSMPYQRPLTHKKVMRFAVLSYQPLTERSIMSYYEQQFKRLNVVARESADLKLQNDQGETHWMRVTPEQIEAILAILKQSEA